ncbi:hypothetical protein SDC9_74772 [bioreactor metagenome]|uniref:Uncharacterized protein n=1 Tax=bioreactor metagenome TaxID=1076179 RepID=A0A644YI06_9ZZZZ
MADVHNAGSFAEAVDGADVLDHLQAVNDRMRVDERAVRQSRFKRFVFVIGKIPFRQIVRHTGFHADPSAVRQIFLDEVGNLCNLILSAHGGKPHHVVFVQPAVVRRARRVDDKRKRGRQPVRGNYDKAAPGEERVRRPAHGAEAGAEV